jgi:geranylgeranyl diphosphate synthase type II
MKSIPELHDIIEKELSLLNYPNHPANLYQPIKYVLNIGGKRMRPILMLLSHQLFSSNINKSVKSALAIEVFHNFTLLHDDIMDKAPLRRGVETVHEKWDVNTAILSGDTMLVQSYELLSEVEDSNLREVLEVFNKAAREVCEGQQWDMDFENREDVTISDYLKMIEYKTSVLLAAALKIGAINGGASKEEAENMYQFGVNMGVAFQLKDDLLDAFGNPENFGKQVGGDILSKKKTYLYLKALENSNDLQKQFLLSYFSSENKENNVDKVKNIFSELEIPKRTLSLMSEYYNKAMIHLDAIKSNNKAPLILFSNQLKERIN